MLPQPNQSSPVSQTDAELECYLCLAAALQANEPNQAVAVERLNPSAPAFLRGLQTLLKGLRKSARPRAV